MRSTQTLTDLVADLEHTRDIVLDLAGQASFVAGRLNRHLHSWELDQVDDLVTLRAARVAVADLLDTLARLEDLA
jgi:hypothetical protein